MEGDHLRTLEKTPIDKDLISGTFGDLYSFVHHMKRRAAKLNVDLLLVDSGDLHDGNGLSDGFPKGGVNGHEVRIVE